MQAAIGRAVIAASLPGFDKPTLLDVPISNNGGRCRYIIYKKKLEDKIAIDSPKVLGGLKSEQYLALNPQGLMPLLVFPDGTSIPESEVIAAYLADKYCEDGPSFQLSSPEQRANDLLARRIHDLYICSIQGAMYKEMDIAQRAKLIERLAFQWDVLNGIVKGPYVSGDHLGLADAALFPSLTFARFILPPIFGWDDVLAKRKRLAQYWETMEADFAAARVIAEIEGGLQQWMEAGRWKERGILDQVAQKDYRWAY